MEGLRKEPVDAIHDPRKSIDDHKHNDGDNRADRSKFPHLFLLRKCVRDVVQTAGAFGASDRRGILEEVYLRRYFADKEQSTGTHIETRPVNICKPSNPPGSPDIIPTRRLTTEGAASRQRSAQRTAPIAAKTPMSRTHGRVSTSARMLRFIASVGEPCTGPTNDDIDSKA